MATEADEEPMRSLHEHQEAASGVLAGEQVEQAPAELGCGPRATDDAPDDRLEDDQQHERDVAKVDEQAPSTTPGTTADMEGSSSAMDEDTAGGSATRASTALDNAADLEDGSSAMPECVSDLFGDCTTAELQAEISAGSSPHDGKRDQQQVINPTGAEPASLEQDERRVDSEGSATQQASERQDDLDSQPNKDESLQAPDTPMKDEAAQPSDHASSATDSTNASEAPPTAAATTDNRNAAASGTTVGVKRAAPSPTSALPEFSWNDILRVQNLIERCLQQYLSKREILEALQAQASIDPAFADVVWQKLEEQNPSFFRAYHIQLRLKEQIIAFNYLVAQQKEMSAKRVKRRHVRTSSAAPTSSRRRGSSSGGIFSPSSALGAADALFSSVEDGSEPGQGAGMSASTANSLIAQLPPPSPLPLPSPIKTELDTHAFFT